MDIGFHIRRAMETGRVLLGYRQSEKSLLNGKAKLVILASGAPERIAEKVKYLCNVGSIPLYVYPGTTRDLGHLCNKPFTVAVITVEDQGESSILELARGEST